VAKENLQGVLEVCFRTPRQLDAAEKQFVETLANQAAIAIENFHLLDALEKSNRELRMAYDETIEGWALALEMRDRETEGHTRRVTDLTVRLARRLGIPEGDIVHIRRGALLHDIGKMGIPDAILHKPGKLTEEEWRIMRRHPELALSFLSRIVYLRPALDIPYSHHEKWDGSGYPLGLKGEQIPLAARLFAIADVYDALATDRPYRKAWPREKVLQYIAEQSGKHFDPRLVEEFLAMLREEE
jgi:putative nucleotidyltransferase with HDIG domain